MNYKKGLQQIREMNVAGGAGGMFGAGGNQGGNVGNVDSYAPGDARVPKVIGAGGNDPYEYVNKKNKKKKSAKKDKIPIYRRTFAEMLTTESSEDVEYLLNCIIYSEDINNLEYIKDIMEHYKVEYAVDDNCIIIEGSDEDIQGILEYVKSVITEEEFTNGNVVALIGEMNLSGEKDLHGVSYGMSLNDISKKFGVSVDELSKELNMGIDVEMEHTKNDKLAKKIAMDHLSEFGTGYYTHLKQMENQLNRKNSTKPNNGR